MCKSLLKHVAGKQPESEMTSRVAETSETQMGKILVGDYNFVIVYFKPCRRKSSPRHLTEHGFWFRISPFHKHL